MTLYVLDAGLYTLVVDHGRPHCRHLGVSVGGAADRTALAIGNALVGNPPDAAALEFSLKGPTVRAECELALVVYGAPFETWTDKRRLEPGKTFTLAANEELSIGATKMGMRGYLCVQGGISSPLILDSRSSLAPLKAGDKLPCRPGRIGVRFASIDFKWLCGRSPGDIHVVDGPQGDWFTTPLFRDNASPPFVVRKESNRMGLRLEGPALAVPDREMISEPVAPGAVQVTRDGQCIILGIDGQTIGGYPKIAQVIAADLDLLAQLRPGDQIRFVHVDLDEARRLYQEKTAEVREWCARLRTSLGGE